MTTSRDEPSAGGDGPSANEGESAEEMDGELLALGIAVGPAFGAALGVAFGNLALGLSLGLGAGIAIGAVLASR